ncbi:MAG: guanylate kinase [Dehalococcoidales bacterium]|nr:guanylate kinase [Dehalococcoidales bacterium]
MSRTDCEFTDIFHRVIKPLLVVVSGPSGVGKDAILSRMKQSGYPFEYIVTVTTRPRRASEVDRVDYHFVSETEFKDLMEHNGLLEWALVYGNWYGVPREPVKSALERGRDTIIKVDVQGARNIKKIVPEAVFIFIAPPSLEELAERLSSRKTESASDLAVRLNTAGQEMREICNFDYVVINRHDRIDEAIAEILAIVKAEKCRVIPRNIEL